MNKLDKIISELKASDSLHDVRVGSDFISVNSIKLTPERRHLNFKEDPLTMLTSKCCVEGFDSKDGKFKINKDESFMSTMVDIHDNIMVLLANHMPQKHPKETKMYKFFRNLNPRDMDTKMENIFIELYSYSQDENIEINDRRDQVIKILKYVYSKNS